MIHKERHTRRFLCIYGYLYFRRCRINCKDPHNVDKLYVVNLDTTTHVLSINRWKWSLGGTEAIESIEEISSFEDEVSFIYDSNIFLYCLTQDTERVLDEVVL